jgi:NADH-quinone oxidoreductase subunit L
VKFTYSLLWLIPVLPLIGALLNGALSLGGASSRRGPARGFVALVAVLAPALSFVLTILATGQLASHVGSGNTTLEQQLWQWMAVSSPQFSFHLSVGLLFDHLTAMMLLFVTGIGTLIHLYSVGYMWEDRGFARFMAYMNLFMFSMITLVIGDSLPMTFVGWEGVGLCSYLLIGFWHHNNEYNDAARKAFVVNRIGDLGFLLGAFILFQVMNSNGGGSLAYRDIASWFQNFANLDLINAHLGQLGVAAILIFFGCTGKSAQIPLVTWLPDAMAGPTPVSALIHAATMVTSGVYLLARLCDVYAHATAPVLCGLTVNQVILVVGCATAAWGAIAGLLQVDIKKALAYSTVSQLGFMFMAAGAGAYDVALFHVFTHAFFKATLFLGAGSVIHGLHHEQDMRRMGGLTKLMPITHLWMFWAWFAIIGLPILGAGSFSKDLILDRLFEGGGFTPVIGGIALALALVTAVYMTRVMYLTFWSPSRMSAEVRAHVHESPITMLLPISILGFGSMVAGWVWAQPDFGITQFLHRGIAPSARDTQPGLHLFSDWLGTVVGPAQSYTHHQLHPGELEHAVRLGGLGDYLMPFLGTLAAVIGLLIARALWGGGKVTGPAEGDITGFSASWTFMFDRLYRAAVVIPLQVLAWILSWVVNAAIEGLVSAIAALARFMGDGYASVQRPRLRSSLVLSVAGAATLVAVLLLQGAIAWAVGLVGASVAVLFLLLELFF